MSKTTCLCGALLTIALAAACEPAAEDQTITGHRLLQQIEAGTAPLILDVRTPAEFASGHLPGAINIPHVEIPAHIGELIAATGTGATGQGSAHRGDIVLYCDTGLRGLVAERALLQAGFSQARRLSGNLPGWEAAGFPLERSLPQGLYETFDGADLDLERWRVAHRNWGGQVAGELSYNGGVVPDNFEIREGQGVFHAHGDHYGGPVRGINRDRSPRPDGKRTGAALYSREAFASGRYEVRMKVAPELGVCSAIWTYHYEDPQPGPGEEPHPLNHEIDIELPGRPAPEHEHISFRRALMVTWVGLSHQEHTTTYADLGAPQDDGQFHTYRFDWHTGGRGVERRVDFYVDDELITTTRTNVPTHAGHFWIGAWFPRNWAGTPDFISTEMVVDWVRITPYGEEDAR